MVEYLDNADLMQILKRTDKVVGVDLAVANPGGVPELSTGRAWEPCKEPDYEKVLSLDPICSWYSPMPPRRRIRTCLECQCSLPACTIPNLSDLRAPFTDAVRKLGLCS